jgi:hypothetical protein
MGASASPASRPARIVPGPVPIKEDAMTNHMRLSLVTVCLAIAPTCRAGQATTGTPTEDTRVLARISYDSTYVSDAEEKRSPRICFEIYQNGRYKIRKMQKGATESLAGNLSSDEMQEVKKMLKNLDFKSSEGGLVRRGTESFVAEVVGKEESEQYLWMNPDHQRPFPASAANIIRWLQAFDDRRAAPFADPELSFDPICPRALAKPVQPAVPK